MDRNKLPDSIRWHLKKRHPCVIQGYTTYDIAFAIQEAPQYWGKVRLTGIDVFGRLMLETRSGQIYHVAVADIVSMRRANRMRW